MADLKDRKLMLTSLDANHIILDIGLTHTKCGFNKDAVPLHIVPTPFKLTQYIRDNITDLKSGTFADTFSDSQAVYQQVEEFLTQVFYHLLQTNPKEKAIVVLESFYGSRCLTECIAHCCFRSFKTTAVYLVLSNALPLYPTGLDSGLVIDCGFQ